VRPKPDEKIVVINQLIDSISTIGLPLRRQTGTPEFPFIWRERGMWQVVADKCEDLLFVWEGIWDPSTAFGIGEELLAQGFPIREVRFRAVNNQRLEYPLMRPYSGFCQKFDVRTRRIRKEATG
jgi:hypothetical protein